ncbi:MAG TPA: glycosyltransferase [Propionibacteriaceae bacterium]|nr:glycosyltransferase [Propionibacteriaceae bacterium]
MLQVRAAIVAYEPGPALVELCRVLGETGMPVLVVDNASSQGRDWLAAAEEVGATVTRLDQNRGVAGALNVALATSSDAEWLLTLDQDSLITAEMVDVLTRSSARLDPRVAIVAPIVRDDAAAEVIQGDPDADGWYLADRVLTSGSLCRVAALRDIGGFRDDLFIDLVDWDVGLRLRASGWTLAIEPKALLMHSLGRATGHRVPGIGRVVTTNHAPDRQYYKVRNFLLLGRDGSLGAEPGWAARTGLGLLSSVAKVVAFEPDKRAKLGAMAQGLRDGLLGRGGPRRAGATRTVPQPGTRPPVSVCMATYNGAAYVRVQLDSILAQLTAVDEVVIQDDCSSDETIAIIESYEDPRLVIERNVRNAGVIPTFERALARATHEIVFLSDQDDQWLPGKVDVVTSQFNDPRVTGVVTDAIIVDETGRMPDQSYFAHARSGPGVLHNFIKNSYLGCCLAIRRKVLAIALPVPRAVRTHDGWIGICADLMGRVVFLDTPYVRYRRHDANLSQMHRFGFVDIATRRLHLAANLVRVAPRAWRRDAGA